MTVPVLTAVTGAAWEASLVAGLQRAVTGITVVRRCVDLADLLAAASAGTARGALLSAELRRLDRDALARLAAAQVAVVGLFTPGDDAAQLRLRHLGVAQALPADASPEDISAAVSAALRDLTRSGTSGNHSYADPISTDPIATGPISAGPPGARVATDLRDRGEPATPGRLVAVWGPTGAPGRTTVAVTVATELARSGVRTVLADADVYGGVIHQVLGFLDEAPGLASACRLANGGQLDLPALAKVAPTAETFLRVLTGISRASRWPELRPSALTQVWAICRELGAVTVVDCGFALEQDEELSYDTAAPRRNGATLCTLEAADTVVAVAAADPVGVQRLLRGLSDLREAIPGVQPRVVLNQVRRGAVGSDPQAQLAEALERYAGVSDITFVPADRDALDAAVLQGRPLVEVAPTSPARLALAGFAAELAGLPSPRRRRLLHR